MKVLFLDRDGILNEDVSYLYKISDLKWVPGIFDALRLAREAGYELIVVTNQSGVARGMFTEEDVQNLHEHMQDELLMEGIPLLDIYYCPHLEGAAMPAYDVVCDCRKPKPGMILQAMEDHPIDSHESFLIGDSPRDVEAAHGAGISGYLYQGGDIVEFVTSCLEAEKNKVGTEDNVKSAKHSGAEAMLLTSMIKQGGHLH